MTTNAMRWTNQSVINFAGETDPVRKIEDMSRNIALKAIDDGWLGPPFDPIKLAEFLKINLEPNSDISDARTVPTGDENFKIEFNPNRPRGRVRFSIAHEIAHTFFDDCHHEIRNREPAVEYADDNWQLEMLCNIAAAELIMPIGSHPDLENNNFTIEHVLELRKKYDVSTEALLIRLVKLTEKAVSVFSSSKIENGKNKGKYRVDYMIPSESWAYKTPAGAVLPVSNVISECTAIGFVSKGNEKWNSIKNELYVECVGLPPYPGSVNPRAAGFVTSDINKKFVKNEIKYHEGDATNPGGKGKKIVAHILNDKTPNWGGRGFAVALKKKFPETQKTYRNWVNENREAFKLGNIYTVKIADDFQVVNMISQKGFGPSESPRIRYSALRQCLEKLAEISLESKSSVHMPRIGAGNAGGHWPIVYELIHDILLARNIDVNIYDYQVK
jgi:Zn-dependent peptidase ImmA (M78 family)/O-acetyl-ADP-ribose deacetylase (regulator of RNase III)